MDASPRSLTDRAQAAGDPPAGARVVDVSPCPPGHNTPFPLRRSPPASFKRSLGGPTINQCVPSTRRVTCPVVGWGLGIQTGRQPPLRSRSLGIDHPLPEESATRQNEP